MKEKTMYKILNRDLTSPYQNFQFHVDRQYYCDNFNESKNIDCAPGFYVIPMGEVILYHDKLRNGCLCKCQVWGKEVVYSQSKQRYEYICIDKIYSDNELKRKLKCESKKLGYDLYYALYPINPLEVKQIMDIEKAIKLLKIWASVWTSVGDSVLASVRASVGDSVLASVRASVGDSVWASVGDSVRASVWTSVRTPVGDSVWDSVRAYISSLFPNIKKWKYIDHEEGVNPFKSCIDLWKGGYIPSFDGKIWRLHCGKDAKVVYQIEKEQL